MISANCHHLKQTGDKKRRWAPARLRKGSFYVFVIRIIARAPARLRKGAVSARALLLQTLAHTVIFGAQNAGGFAERALLAADTAATAALGLGGAAFCLVNSFTTNVINVCQLVVGRRAGGGDDRGARTAAGQALLLASCGGGAVGLTVAAGAAAAAACADGPARAAALFLAAQGLALGPLMAAKALIGYFAGMMRVGPRLLVAVSLTPIAAHLALAWLLTRLLSWSVAGAGLARLGAALAAAAAVLAVARAEFGGQSSPARRPDWRLLRAMLAEGSLLGLQQALAGLMVLLLYLTAARAGDVTSAALALTHSGVYPLLFAFAWGTSQAVGAAAALAVARRDSGELTRITWLGLGLAAMLAFALPWGAYAVCGRPALAWLAGAGPTGGAVLAASLRLMGLLAVFFVFDFAINFLTALLRAVNEEAYLVKATAAAVAGFGLLLVALPPRPGPAYLMAAFIAAQAAWALLLLIRVAGRWPGAAARSLPAHPGDEGGRRKPATVPLSSFRHVPLSPRGLKPESEATGRAPCVARRGEVWNSLSCRAPSCPENGKVGDPPVNFQRTSDVSNARSGARSP
jgi:Na+-driven multidrug efflux pump